MHSGQTAPVPVRKANVCGQGWSLALLAAALFCATADAHAIFSEAREILGPGYEVEGIDQPVGVGTFQIICITNDDRVVFQAVTSTGAEGVFSADGTGVETLWLARDPDDHPLRLGRVRCNANGVVYAAGHALSDLNLNDIAGFYQISGGVAAPAIEQGDITPEGDELCYLLDFVLSDAGALGFSAFAAPPEANCALSALEENLYVLEGESVRRVFKSGSSPRIFRLVGLADDGTLLVSVSPNAISMVRDGQIDRVVSSMDTSPRGMPYGSFGRTASNSVGDVAFEGDAGSALYRTRNGSVVLVAEEGDRVDGDEISAFSADAMAINDAGVVVTTVELREPGGMLFRGAVLFPPGGEPQLVRPGVEAAGINDRGVVAFRDHEPLEGQIVGRGTQALLEKLVGLGDPAPDGGVFATAGIEESHLAPDGRVAAVVHAGSLAVLTCGDAEGFVAVVEDARYSHEEHGQIVLRGTYSFAETGILFIGGQGEGLPSLYLATDDGLERLLGPGDVTPDGASIIGFTSLHDPAVLDNVFDSNERGAVLVRAVTDQGARFLRRQPTGELTTVDFDIGPDVAIARFVQVSIADDDRVVSVVQLDTGEYAIVVADGASARVLVTETDPRLPGGPLTSISLLYAGADRIVFTGDAPDSGDQKTVSYTEAGGITSFFADGVERHIRELTAAGRALISDLEGEFLFLPDGTTTLLVGRPELGKPIVLGINDRDNVLFLTYNTELGTSKQSLALSGPPPAARCPRQVASVTPTATETATALETETPAPTETPVPSETRTPTPQASPTPTSTPTPTIPATTVRATDTAVPSATSVPPVTAPRDDFDDGCQTMPASGGSAWPILALVALLIRTARRR